MIDSVRCEYCNRLFLKLDPALFDNDPGISKASISKHDCPLKFGGQSSLKTQVFEVSDYKAAMLLIDLPALDKRLSIDMNYQPKSANRYVNSSTIYQRLFQASGTVTDFLCYLPEQQALRLPDLISYLQSLGYIVTAVGPIAKVPEHG